MTMFQKIIGTGMKFRFLVVIIAAGMLVFGALQIRRTPVDILPEFTPPYVAIQTESLGLSADEVEQLITVPMEQDLLNGMPWLDTIRSESVPGLSTIVLVFKPGTNLMQARQMVSERMTQAVALPHVSKPPVMLQPLSTTGRVLIVGLSSKTLSLVQMGVLARWTIVPRLMGIPGVANVSVWGQRDRQLQVLVDPRRMQTRGVSLQDVLETAGNALWVSTLSYVEASTPGTGGFIDTPNQRLGIFHISPIVTADGLEQVPIADLKKSDGSPLRLSDVATVVEDHQPLIGDAVVNNSSGLLLVVEKFPGANPLEVTRGLEDALAEMQPGLPNITIDTGLYRPATFIETALNNVTLALILSSLLLALLLGIFYWDWRLALISLVVVPLSLVAATLVFSRSGATINVMVLAGLMMAVGVVVDDTIIDVENIVRRLRQARQAGSSKPAATIMLEASCEMRNAVFFATLIVLVAVVPVFFIQGQAGAFYQPMGIAYLLAIVASMIVALLVTPALCLTLLANASMERRTSPLVRWLQAAYERTLAQIIRQPRPAFLALTIITLAGIAAIPFLSLSPVPTFKERDLLIDLTGAPGMSQPEMSRIATMMSSELRAIPGVRDVGALIGRAVLGDQVVNVNSSQIWLSINPAVDYDSTVAAIRGTANGYPGIRYKVETYLKEASSMVAAQPTNTLVVRVYGDVDATLQSQAAVIQKAIGGIKGVASSRIDLPVQQLTVETEVKLDAAKRYGIKPGDVRRAAATLLAGIQVGNLFEEQKVFDVVVWSTPETRHSLNSISKLLIDTPDGKQVELGDIADVRIVPTDADIRHEAVKRYMDVIVSVSGRSPGSVAVDIKNYIQQIPYPLEYHATLLNDYEMVQKGQVLLIGAILTALIGIMFLLQAAFRSWRLAVLSFLILPAVLVGGIVSSYVGGTSLSIGALGGFFAVFAIAARNGILLINHYQRLQWEEGEPFGLELVLRGARERLAPTVMTALAAGLAFTPALVLGDIPGLEIMRPMAIFMIGALIASTLLNLFILPTLYLLLKVRPAPELDLGVVQAVMPTGLMDENRW